MPIYEYYCPACNGRFSHLARRYDEPPPPCPGCGSTEVEKLISSVHLGRSDRQRWIDYQARSQQIDQDDLKEVGRFLQKSGDLGAATAPVETEIFREIVARRAEGAGDDDMQDLVDAIPDRKPAGGQIDPHEHHHHEGPHTHEHSQAKDLGWA